ncbi:MAG TPA: LysR family transcriptional regulator [Rhizomicrobium sp.]|jgi:DNA-binding transcriptional LysR family regulator
MDNWDDIRIFLAVARNGGMTAAAQNLNVNHTTVARRLSSLETALKTRLVLRTTAGVTLTPAGTDFMRFAERMEAEVLAADQHLRSKDGKIAGKVRLATREAFGQWLVCPRIGELHARYPDLVLELVPESRTFNLLNHDVDISVTVTHPSQNRLIAQKLTDYRLGLFASHQYLEREGPVKSLGDLKNRQVIWYVEDMIDMDVPRYFKDIVSTSRSTFRATNILAQYAATVSGAGLGILQLYRAGQDPALVRVLPDEVEETLSYWMSVHPDSRNLPNVRAVMDFLIEIIRDKKDLF